jgi:hypothetical protein
MSLYNIYVKSLKETYGDEGIKLLYNKSEKLFVHEVIENLYIQGLRETGDKKGEKTFM